MIQASIVPVTPFQQNCSILWCEKTKKAAVVDPGGDIDRILKVARTIADLAGAPDGTALGAAHITEAVHYPRGLAH